MVYGRNKQLELEPTTQLIEQTVYRKNTGG